MWWPSPTGVLTSSQVMWDREPDKKKLFDWPQTTCCCSRHPLILDLCNVGGFPKVKSWTQFYFSLIYVNDISSNISSTLRMFADDTKVYRELSNITRDSEALQFDVDQLLSWASKWQLCFNPDKCKVLCITHKRYFFLPAYSLGTSLKSVKCIKDLGIMVSSDLSWSEHVNAVR